LQLFESDASQKPLEYTTTRGRLRILQRFGITRHDTHRGATEFAAKKAKRIL
jgi:hypothetical protein